MSSVFSTGQRWISDTETDLGLGTVLEVDFRHVTVVFTAVGDTRRYAMETAPLTRVEFSPGDVITSHEGWRLKIQAVTNDENLLFYTGIREDTEETTTIDESKLDHFLQFGSPRERLFAGLIDGPRWFNLRRRVFDYRHDLARSPVRGIAGTRVSILEHQMYIAVDVSRRLHPRVLLADEVGLGKTIEAGMILHAQLVNQQVSRVLIVVPPALLHQWLVEMLRKFNIAMSIMDAERFNELAPSAPNSNPFLAEQQVLMSLNTLTDNPAIHDAALEAGWDMLIVDEAHHLTWEPGKPSADYLSIESLALETPSVLLLTATPEQLGQAGHFARLRLLDADRFTSLDAYLEQETQYAWLAAVASKLQSHEALDDGEIKQLETLLDESFNDTDRATLQSSSAMAVTDLADTLTDQLIDRHGTGRLLFRNTRHAIKGFPERHLHSYELADDSLKSISDWLMDFLKDQFPNKVLLICRERRTVDSLAERLRQQGVSSARFHEHMSIVERDRAAAYFADPEDDCRILLCSEIGSEGRNFQFLHHLVMIDLPSRPDQLEQRIGRLDRIGQENDIELHVPYTKGSLDHQRMRWYHEGLNAFESICRTGDGVVRELGDDLHGLLGEHASVLVDAAPMPSEAPAGDGDESTEDNMDSLVAALSAESDDDFLKAIFGADDDDGEDGDSSPAAESDEALNAEPAESSFEPLDDAKLDDLITRTQSLTEQLSSELESGRDRLLELHSNRPDRIQEHLDALARADRDVTLPNFMSAVFDRFGVDVEEQGHWWIVRPGDHMQVEKFPHLPADGLSLTFERDLALQREDFVYLSWDHPMVTDAMDLILNEGYGQGDAQVIATDEIRQGMTLIEAVFTVQCTAPAELRTDRYLRSSTKTIHVGIDGKDYTENMAMVDVESHRRHYDRNKLKQVVLGNKGPIGQMIEKARTIVDADLPDLLAEANEALDEEFAEDIDRLKALSKVNPLVSQEDIAALETRREAIRDAIAGAFIHPVSVRVLFNQ